MAETGVDMAHILTMLKDIKDMRAPGSGSPVKDHPESEDDEEAGSRDSDSVSIASDESEDLMRNLTGVSRQKTSKKACAKSAGKNAKDKMAMARASGKVIHPKRSSSAASTKPSSAPSSRPAGSANPKRERVASSPVEATVAGEAAKKLKADSGDLDPKLYLGSNGFGNIRNEIGAIASRILKEPLLLEWTSDAGDVSKLMAQYCIEFKPILADFLSKYWVIKKRVNAAQPVKDLVDAWAKNFRAPNEFVTCCKGDIDHSADGNKMVSKFQEASEFFGGQQTPNNK